MQTLIQISNQYWFHATTVWFVSYIVTILFVILTAASLDAKEPMIALIVSFVSALTGTIYRISRVIALAMIILSIFA
ncbi:MAG: hypothetical protein RSH78_00295 [Bacilli bacterium]|uniref:hypothetical protein n=1 Tax=Clostridium sp. TaxID=1506 RepID=UPI002FC95437